MSVYASHDLLERWMETYNITLLQATESSAFAVVHDEMKQVFRETGEFLKRVEGLIRVEGTPCPLGATTFRMAVEKMCESEGINDQPLKNVTLSIGPASMTAAAEVVNFYRPVVTIVVELCPQMGLRWQVRADGVLYTNEGI